MAGRKRFFSCSNAPILRAPLAKSFRSQNLLPLFRSSSVRLKFASRRNYASSSGRESDGEEESGTAEEEEEELSGSDREGGESKDPTTHDDEGELGGLEMLPVARHHALAPVNIPDNFPEVPILPISRNPLFPRFVKMLEVSG